MIRLQTPGGRKSRLLFTLLLFMSFSSCFGQERGYAVFDSSTGTLTFQYGTPTGTAGTDYYNTDKTGTSYPGWRVIRTSIEKVVFDSSFANARPASCYCWFYGCSKLTDITGIENLNTSLVIWMGSMFSDCSSLTSLDVTHFNTANVTDMSCMFWDCSSLANLDVTGFDTSSVKNMSHMFANCSGLTSLDVSGFETSNVTNMAQMFSECRGLTNLDVSEFDTSKVTYMYGMFYNCSGLTSLDVTGFDTSNVTDMASMFFGCSGLTSLTFGEKFTTTKVTNWNQMFRLCSRLRYLDFYASNDVIGTTKLFTETNIFSGYEVFSSSYGPSSETVMYMPHGISMSDYANCTKRYNLVFNDNGTLKATCYSSSNKTDIEFPREFKATTAKYSRIMTGGTKYGTVILPYEFNSNDEVQAYTLNNEFESEMYFVEAATVPAHTPFFYRRKITYDTTVNFNNTAADYGITVAATHTTSAAEGGEPYTAASGMDGWTTKGYYITEEIDATPASPTTNTFYIAGDKFWRATGTLKMNPHRVTYQGQWQYDPDATEAPAMLNIITMGASETGDDLPSEVSTAIEAAHLRSLQQNARDIYDAQGRRQSELKSGLNIVRMADGTTVKIVKR